MACYEYYRPHLPFDFLRILLQAYDLVDHRYVACKLHGLNAQWSEEKKQSYIRHAIREYNIHKSLVHHHIVRLWDIFEIDHNTFCTILEYCSGIITFSFSLSLLVREFMVLESGLFVRIFQVLLYYLFPWMRTSNVILFLLSLSALQAKILMLF